jgi:hypothetical protein
MKSLGARRGSLPLLALLAGALTSGCWIALGIEDLSSDGLETSTNGGGGGGAGGGGGGGAGGTGPCDPSSMSCGGDVEWAKRFGDPESQSSAGIAVDSAGNILVVGNYHGQINFGEQPHTSAGGKDIFLARLSPDGSLRWSRTSGDALNQYATGVATDGSDNVIVLGHFEGYADFGGGPVMSAGFRDIVVAKLSSENIPIWTKRFGSPAEEGSYALAVDSSDNVLLAGFSAGDIDFGGPVLMGSDGLLFAKLDGSGGHIWSRRFSADSQDLLEPVHIAADPSGGVVFTTSFGGSIYIDSITETTSPDDRDLLIAKLDPTGMPSWSLALGDGSLQYGKSVAVDGEGNVFVAADLFGSVDIPGGTLTSAGSSDVLLLKLNPFGAVLWAKRFGDANAQTVSGIGLDGSGNILMAGAFKGSLDFGGGPLESAGADDIFVVKLDPSGNHRWSRRFGGAGAQSATAVAADPSEFPAVLGDLFGDADFGSGPLTSAGSDDVFVLKLSP